MIIRALFREIDSATDLTPEEKGKSGEHRIQDMLNVFEKFGDIVLNDVIIPNINGNTAQIDHILISKKGVFVIETKNITGFVVGDDSKEQWDVHMNKGKSVFQMYSPVKQNEGHIKALKSLFEDRELPITNMVVFARGNTKGIRSNYVYIPATMFMLLRALPPNKLSQEEVDFIASVIQSNRTNGIEKKEKYASVSK